MLFPSEMVILMAIAGAGDFGKKMLTRPMDVTGQYIGYLEGNSSRGYQLTLKSRECLFEFVHENKTRIEDTIRTLQLTSYTLRFITKNGKTFDYFVI